MKTNRTDFIDLSVGILFGLIVILIFTQVIFRYFFNNSLNWTEELAKYLFVWMTFIGSASAFKDQIHIGVDFFVELLPDKQRRYANVMDIALITLFSAIATVVGYMWTADVWGTLSPALELPLSLVLYAAFPTGSMLICVFGLRQLANQNTNQKSKEEAV